MADFNFYLNRQGVRGPQGIQGPQGFSPIITEYVNTLSEYILQIQTQNNILYTGNLREHKEDLGGTYIRYNRETGIMYAGDADLGSQSQYGVVRFATSTDIEREDDSSVVSPANVADMINATGISGDITELQGQVSTNTNNITTLQGQMTGLLADYVPKSRTINGKALSSNITLTASDVGALPSTTPIPSKTSDLTNDSGFITSADLPDMTDYYTKTQTNTLLDGKADISDIPVVPTNISAFTNDAGYITSSDLPTVGNGTITLTQGGVTKGTFTTNQSGDATIALDATGSSLTAGTAIDITNDAISVNYDSAKGLSVTGNSLGVRVDGNTIDFDASGNLKSLIQAPSYSEGTGIDITNGVISVDFTDVATASQGAKADTAVQPSDLATVATTGDYTDLLNKPTIPDVTHMVTDNTTQTISGAKTFTPAQTFDGGINTHYINNQTGNDRIITISTSNTDIATDSLTITRNNTPYSVVDSGNIGTYALTSLPVATTSTLGGVIADGTTITIDSNGVISSSGGGPSYTAGTGINIISDVISIDNTVVATQGDLSNKQDTLVSGTNIKTINSTSVLGTGDFELVDMSSLVEIYGLSEDNGVLRIDLSSYLQNTDNTKPGYVYKVTTSVNTAAALPSGGTWLIIDSKLVNNSTAVVYYNLTYILHQVGEILPGGTTIISAASGYLGVMSAIKLS